MIAATSDLASGNLSFRGGPLAKPVHNCIFFVDPALTTQISNDPTQNDCWLLLNWIHHPEKLYNLPRFGFPSAFSANSKLFSGINSLNSLKISLALRLNTDHDVQCSMTMRWVFVKVFVDADFFGVVETFAFFADWKRNHQEITKLQRFSNDFQLKYEYSYACWRFNLSFLCNSGTFTLFRRHFMIT